MVNSSHATKKDNGILMHMRVVRELDETVWREYVNQHSYGNIFHTPEMFQVFQKANRCTPQVWATVNETGRITALLTPVVVTITGGLMKRLTSRSIAYGSVLCDASEEGKTALRVLLNSYKEETGSRVLFSELRHISDFDTNQPALQECGFKYEEHLNYLVDLNCPVEQVMENIHPRARKQIRRSLRKGNVVVEILKDRRLLPDWYRLIQRTYRASRVPLTDYSLFEAAFDILSPKGMITFWTARIGDHYVAASAELPYKDTIYGWYGGLDRAYNTDSPGEVLMWRVLEWGVENGYLTYDFGGAGKPGQMQGIRDFKAKFGGKLVCYGRNRCVHSPILLKISEFGYTIFRNLAFLFR